MRNVAERADRHDSGRSAAGSWRMHKVASSHGHACHTKWRSMSPATQSEGRCLQHHACHTSNRSDNGVKRDPRAPPDSEPARCHKRHACHAKWRPMSPSATPATQTTAAATAWNGTQARQQSQPQSDGRCRQAPRLPHKVKVNDVTKRHACYTNSRGGNGVERDPSTPPEPATKWRSMSPSTTPATQSEGRCHKFSKRHACHAKWKPMSPSATPATQTAGASMASNGAQARHQSWPSAISATPGARSEGPAMQSEGRCHKVLHLPHTVKVDVTKRHACHAKWRPMSPSATPATQTGAATTASNRSQARHKCQPSATSATPATQSESLCRQVPCLPHKVKVYVAKRQACHAKWRPMSRSAMLATQRATATTVSNGTEARHQSQPSASMCVRERESCVCVCVCERELCVSKLHVRELCVRE